MYGVWRCGAGKARYIGNSNCYAWQLAKANALAEQEGFAKFVSVQGHYNLIFREDIYAKYKYDATGKQDAQVIQRVQEIAEKRGVTMTEVSLAWLEEPYIPHPLTGVMAQNRPDRAKEKHVWSTGNKYNEY